jgi:hypothetical protein
MMVQVSKFPALLVIHGKHLLHDLKNIQLCVPVNGNCFAYGDDLTQILFLMMRLLKQTVVQTAASTFIQRLFRKLASRPSFHTLIIHRTKYHTMGLMHITTARSPGDADCLYNKNKKKVANPNTIAQNTKVPLLPINILIVLIPSSSSSLC